MGKEIERKFIVADPDSAIAAAASSSHIVQGYLSPAPEATVRVRLRDDRGFLTVKSPNRGAERGEWEYEIPAADARELMALSQTPVIDKRRYLVPHDGLLWEVDVFTSPRELVLAEVELPEADFPVTLPSWIGEEVTSNPAYFNSTLACKCLQRKKS